MISWIVSMACAGVSTRSIMPGVIGLAVHMPTASVAARSPAAASRPELSISSQPPVPGGAAKVRVRDRSPTLAETRKLGEVTNTSCSMYEPSLEAK